MLAPVRRADRVLSLFLLAADTVAVPVIFLLTFWLRSAVIGDHVPGFDVRFGDYRVELPGGGVARRNPVR